MSLLFLHIALLCELIQLHHHQQQLLPGNRLSDKKIYNSNVDVCKEK